VLPVVSVTIGNMPNSRPSKPRASRGRRPSPEVAERRAQKRAELLEVADRVVRREGPGASVNQIAAEAGIAKPVLYRIFGDKGGLYQAIAERYVRQLMEDLRTALLDEAPGRPRLEATIDTYMSFVENNKEVYRFLMHRAIEEQPQAQATVSDFIGQVANEVAIVLGEELRTNGLDSGASEPWAHGIVGFVELAGDWWLQNRSMPRERLVTYLTDLLWKGFRGTAADYLDGLAGQAARDSA
jgi:AcrR family transcriptional regulator